MVDGLTALAIVIAIFGTIIAFHLHSIGSTLLELKEFIIWVITPDDDDTGEGGQ